MVLSERKADVSRLLYFFSAVRWLPGTMSDAPPPKVPMEEMLRKIAKQEADRRMAKFRQEWPV